MVESTHNTKELVKEFFILGVTRSGKQFRPSDWVERLCGVMSCFDPTNTGGRNAHLQFSRFVRPIVLNGMKAVVVNTALRQFEPMAFHFVVDFAKDNDLQVVDACFLPYPNDTPP
ncbi:MAG: hypothetical protein ACI83P_002441 [Janthinobacterium sp.]|jgi:hypothetical protein